MARDESAKSAGLFPGNAGRSAPAFWRLAFKTEGKDVLGTEMRLTTALILLAVMGLEPGLRAQSGGGRVAGRPVDVWQTEDGLPQNSITAIVQTRDGYLWLGTAQRGLVRFDGFQFTSFTTANTPALRSDRISCLHEDSQGTLWIGTEGGGVTRHAGGRFETFTDRRGLTGQRITAIASDSRPNSLWVGTSGGGLFALRDGEFASFPALDSVPGQSVQALLPEGNRVWVATSEHYGYLEDGEFQFLSAGPHRSVTLARAAAGGVWLVVDAVLERWLANGTKESVSGSFASEDERVRVTTVYEDRRGHVWIGTVNHGLFRYSEGGFQRIEGLTSQWVECVFEDREGNLWVGTNGGGLNRLKERLFDVFDVQRGLAADIVLSISEGPDGTVWIGTDGGGLHFWREGRIEHFHPALLRSESIYAVYTDRQTNLWVGTQRNGLFRFTDGRATNFGPATASRWIQAVHEDAQGVLWVGTHDAGVTRITANGVRHLTKRDGLPDDDVRCFQSTDDGIVWIGTGNGLCRWQDGKLEVFREGNGLPSEKIRSLHLDAEGTLWIGTANGLGRHEDGRFQSFSKQGHALHSDGIQQILDDGRGQFGHLWLGSFDGIFRVHMEDFRQVVLGKTNAVSSVVYDVADGLKDTECTGGFQPAGCRTRNGRLWFSTKRGAAMLDLSHLISNPRPPDVVIESFLVDGTVMPLTGPIRVQAGGERFEFTYTAFNFSAPRRLRFRYRLEGHDVVWAQTTPGRKMVYTGLKPGTYTFKVQAGNLDGVWNEIGKSVEFTVLPPYWQTLWFRSLMALVFVALGITTYRYLAVLQLKRRLAELERQQVLERERARIAKDMHDDLGARLTQIGLIGELIRRDSGQADKVAQMAGRLTDAAREVSETVDEIVWAVNPRNDTLDKLVPYLLHYTEEFFEPSPIRYRLDAPEDVPPLPIKSDVRHHVFLVFKEALNNIVKHAQADEVHVRIALKEAVLEISVSDNGRGFKTATEPPLGNGLINMRRRIEECGGSFTLTSEPDRGSEVRVSLPLAPG
jgi:ligand-binding sensor domain-containing protein/signal transduction histidine kinase